MMASYRIIAWKDIPATVEARDDADAVTLPLSERFQALIERTLETPDTWEVALSGGADKKEAFERLIVEDKLGALALLRNLRNMAEAGVDRELIRVALEKMDASRVLPHRFIAAARAVVMQTRMPTRCKGSRAA